jgi:hypothetical protein
MIKINNFEVINEGQGLAINVETNLGFLITSIDLWKMDDFKNPSLAKNLSINLSGINNKEIFIVPTSQLGYTKFEDIYFIEVKSNFVGEEGCSTCSYPALGITYDLSSYYQCMLDYVLQNIDNGNLENTQNKNKAITVNLLINNIENAIEIGLYSESILLIKQLKKLCDINKCKNCKPVYCNSCNGFKQI